MVLKDGIIYHNSPLQDTYTNVYEFIEKAVPEDTDKVFAKYPVGGRITVVGLYLTYWKRETLMFQRKLPKLIEAYLKGNEAPEWCFDILNKYGEQDINVQLAINLGIILYLLCIQFYFFRYMVCASCFDEYKQLKDDIKESERTLDARRKVYNEAM